MASKTTHSVSVHMGEDDVISVEYVAPHDHVVEGYYRLKFGSDATVFLSKQKLDALVFVLKGLGQ